LLFIGTSSGLVDGVGFLAFYKFGYLRNKGISSPKSEDELRLMGDELYAILHVS